MNVFGVGPLELLVVLGVALIFVGPERLPRLAADLARVIRDLRRYTGSIAREFNDAIAEIDRDLESERSEWRDIGQGLGDAASSVNEAFQGAADDASRPPSSNGAATPPGEKTAPTEERR